MVLHLQSEGGGDRWQAQPGAPAVRTDRLAISRTGGQPLRLVWRHEIYDASPAVGAQLWLCPSLVLGREISCLKTDRNQGPWGPPWNPVNVTLLAGTTLLCPCPFSRTCGHLPLVGMCFISWLLPRRQAGGPVRTAGGPVRTARTSLPSREVRGTPGRVWGGHIVESEPCTSCRGGQILGRSLK